MATKSEKDWAGWVSGVLRTHGMYTLFHGDKDENEIDGIGELRGPFLAPLCTFSKAVPEKYKGTVMLLFQEEKDAVRMAESINERFKTSGQKADVLAIHFDFQELFGQVLAMNALKGTEKIAGFVFGKHSASYKVYPITRSGAEALGIGLSPSQACHLLVADVLGLECPFEGVWATAWREVLSSMKEILRERSQVEDTFVSFIRREGEETLLM